MGFPVGAGTSNSQLWSPVQGSFSRGVLLAPTATGGLLVKRVSRTFVSPTLSCPHSAPPPSPCRPPLLWGPSQTHYAQRPMCELRRGLRHLPQAIVGGRLNSCRPRPPPRYPPRRAGETGPLSSRPRRQNSSCGAEGRAEYLKIHTQEIKQLWTGHSHCTPRLG